MINIELEIRKRIVSAKLGDDFTIDLPPGTDPAHTRKRATQFCREKKCPVLFLTSNPGQLRIKRVTPEEANPVAFGEIDQLQIGQSHLFQLPKAHHPRVRMAASVRNRKGQVLLSCNSERHGIRVTRHPLTPEEIAAHGEAPEAPRSSRYGLERLETEPTLSFRPANHAELVALRMAVSTKKKHTGWKLATRTQFDGSVVVTRLDLLEGQS